MEMYVGIAIDAKLPPLVATFVPYVTQGYGNTG